MTATKESTGRKQVRKKPSIKDDIAIIGIGCRFPDAKDHLQFWENLNKGVHSIKTITPDRWDIDEYYSADFNEPNKSQSKWCGLIHNIDLFDNRFFNISPREAKNMDPQQRLLLEETWHCIEDSGVLLSTLQEKITSVYIGVMATDYQQAMSARDVSVDSYAALGNYASILANRLSHAFGFQGQSVSIDAACASSLVAIHQARQSLLNAESDYAIAGGVSLNLHPWKYISFSKARMLSPEGQCKTFDAAADGYVPGEGVGVVLMQPLADAKRQGNHVYGLIKGSAVNHCGKTLSITAPLVEAQKKVILSAYEDAAIHPETVTYTEAHGTGTSLGDPIEVESLTKAFAVHTGKKGFCKIGSVKTNIGHLEAAAGIAGVIKVLMMMRNRTVPKTLNIKRVNPMIRFEDSPFILAHAQSTWQSSHKGLPLRAGVSSLGMGGVNSHILLEEHIARRLKPEDDPQRPHLFVLSAKQSSSLEKLIAAWKTFVKGEIFGSHDLKDICATLSAGRQAFSYRYGVLVENKARLKRILSGQVKPAVVQSQKNWCLRIGEFSFQGSDEIRKLGELNLLFKQKLNGIKAVMKKLELPKSMITGFSKKKWPAAKIPLYSFMAGYAFIRVMIDSGFKPRSITGEKSGLWIALVLSGVADLSSVLTFLAGKSDIAQIGLRRPSIPFWDPDRATAYLPFDFNAGDVSTMIKAVTPSKNNPWLDEHTVGIYMDKARLLVDRQFTFTKYLKDWDAALAPSGRNVLQMIEDDHLPAENQESGNRSRLLLLVIILSALHRLHKKWHLTEPGIITHEPLHELMALVNLSVMPKEIVVDLLSSDKPDYHTAARVLNQRQVHLNPDHRLAFMKSRKTLAEISDIPTWIAKMTTRPAGPGFSAKTGYWEIGKFSRNAPAQISIQTEMSRDLVTRFCESLLQLWLQGFDMKLDCIYPAGPFHKVSLPVYPFEGKSFWLPPRKTEPETPVPESEISSPKIAGQYLCSRTDQIIQDHIITGRHIIPAAYMLSLVADSIQKTWRRPLRRFQNVIIHNPGIVGNPLTVKSEIDARQFKLSTKAARLCTGELSTIAASPVPMVAPFDLSPKKNGSCRQIYRRLHQAGYHYGKGLQVLKKSWMVQDRYVFELKGPVIATDERFYLEPAVLDGVFQAMLAAAMLKGLFAEQDHLYIPYITKSLDIYASVMGRCFVSVSKTDIAQRGPELLAGARVYNGRGHCAAQIRDMLFKRVPLDFLTRSRTSLPQADTAVARQTSAACRPETATVPPATERVYYYAPKWSEQAPPEPAGQGTPRQAIVFSNDDAFTDKLGRQLEEVYPSITFIQKSDVLEQGYLKALERRFDETKDRIADIFWLWGYAPEARAVSTVDALADIQDEVIIGLSQLAAELTRLKRPANIVIPTIDAFVIEPEDKGSGYALGGLSGLARTIMIENPGIGIKIVDFDKDDPRNSFDLMTEASRPDQSEVVGYRNKTRYLRTVQSISPDRSQEASVWKDGGVYLLIGGLGGLGRQIAQEISRNLNVKLVLCGRSQLDPQKQKIIEDLGASGSEVVYYPTDVTDQDQVRHLIKTVKDRFGALNGVIHSAGVLDDKLLISKDRASFQKVMASKVMGAWIVNQITRSEDLDFFAVFSSIVALVGNLGQADYAAANSFLDAFMHFRAQNEFPGRSISFNWTLWSDGGMGSDPRTRHNFKVSGLEPIPTRVGSLAFNQILHHPGLPQVVVSGSKITAFAKPKDKGKRAEASKSKPSEKTHDPKMLEAYILDLIARKIDTTPSQIDKDGSFFELGVESVALMDIMAELDKAYDHLSPTLLFEHTNTRELVDFLKDQPLKDGTGMLKRDNIPVQDPDAMAHIPTEVVHSPWGRQPPHATNAKETVRPPLPLIRQAAVSRGNGYDIAIIGMSGRFPEAPDIETYWRNLISGKDCIKEIPGERWDHMAYFDPDPNHPHTAYAKWGGFIEDVDKFDPQFFNISPREAEEMDPQQRLLLECTWHTMEHAGYGVKKLWKNKTVGLYAGIMWNEYSQIGTREGFMQNRYVGPGSLYWAIANRVSYFMGFTGPSLAIDTACSSSLTALHLACQGILNNECEMAVAGGVNLSIHPEKYIYLSQAKFLAADGRCRSFGKEGDGYVPGEGVGMVLLKPLKQAIQDRDHIWGICRGSSINHGGKAAGFTVPNPEAHTRLIIDAMQTANVSPGEIGYVECHGTGTSLGDPIEIQGLTKAFVQKRVAPQSCPIGSVKSNIGHLEAAAGIAAVIKVLLCMRHDTIPMSLHSEELNPAIDFIKTPFYVAKQNMVWPAQPNHTRLAGVSSFGAGGANAHAILQAFDQERSTAEHKPQDKPVIFVLSAANRPRLEAYAGQLADFLETDPDLNLNDVAYTLQTGRQAMADRFAMVSTDRSKLIRGLRDFSVGRIKSADIFTGNVKTDKVKTEYLLEGEEGRDFIKTVVDRKKLDKIGQLWVSGVNIDWQMLHVETAAEKIPLPGYPFERHRFWIPEADLKTAARPAAAAGDAIHPLLHNNTSDFFEQRFSSTFTGKEFFLSDHVVSGQKVLSGAAQLEMANIAVRQAAGVSDAEKVHLENIAWIRPFIVAEQQAQIHIRLFPQDHQQIDYEIYSGSQTPDGEEIIHSQGRAELILAEQPVSMDIADLEKACRRKGLPCEQYYKLFKKMGLRYGPAHRGLQTVHLGDGQALIKLALPAGAKDVGRYDLHPSLIDSAFQGALVLSLDLKSKAKETLEPVLPFALDELQILGPCSTEMWVLVRVDSKYDKTENVKKFDIDMADATGKIQVRLHGFTTMTQGSAKKTDAVIDTRSTTDLLMLKPQWSHKPVDQCIEDPKYIRHEMVLCEPSAELEKRMNTHFKNVSIHTCKSDTAAIDKRYQTYALKTFKAVRNIMNDRPKGKVLVQVVVPTDMDKQLFCGLSGLLKTASFENPNFTGQTILIDSGTDDIADKLTQDKRHTEDRQILYRDGKRWVLELIEDRTSTQLPWKEKGVYLITGGAGGLGLIFADEIVKQTRQVTLILAGRSKLDPVGQKRIDKLSRSGANIDYYRVDVAKEKEVAQLLEIIGQRYARLDGIIHSAGIVRDNYMIKKRAEEFEQVLMPKVAGLVNLDNASRNFDLDFLVLFSSVSASFGNPGQSDYAAANGFMDAYAAYRNRLVSEKKRQGHTVSINWPLWKQGGMHVDATTEQLLRQNMGIVAMATKTGIQAFYQALSFGTAQVIVMEGEPERMKQRFGLKRPSDPSPEALSGSYPQPSQARRVIADDELIEKTSRYLKTLVSGVIKLAPEQIDASAPMEQYGIDSVMVMQLTNELEKHFGSLSKTLFFEYQTIEQLSAYFTDAFSDQLARLLGMDQKPEPALEQMQALQVPKQSPGLGGWRRFAPLRAEAQAKQETDMAVIGMAGRYPHALTLCDFWENLKSGKDCIEQIPAERWDYKLFYDQDKQAPGKTYSKWGGFIQGVEWFDPLFFNISPREALLMDPQERLFLQCVYETLEDAGYTRQGLGSRDGLEPGGNVGVYVGVMYSEYQLYGAQQTLSGNPMALSGNPAAIPNRVSYFCNFNGPSMAVDTMCSSSLTAVHLACQSLIRGHCKLAVAGGVNVSIHPNKYLLLAQGKFLSSSGRCEAFGVGGEGYVPGEGVGSVLLKPLSAAVADNDHIYGIIKGSAINHGGKTNGFTVPNPNAQANVIGKAFKEAGIDPRAISYIEAHGTGTSLGDPIEISGLSKAFEEYGAKDKQFCAIGSVKSNIGHCESAAGIAGLTKILLQMKHHQLVPSLHCNVLNAHIDFDNSPFTVQQALSEWKPPLNEMNGQKKEGPRVAGISAFGAGGSNAHLIVEEYAPAHGDRDTAYLTVKRQGPVVVVLSAKTKAQLRTQAEQLISFIASESMTDKDLADLAFTLQMGREASDQRLALIVKSMADLSQKLGDFVKDRPNIEGLHLGQVQIPQAKETIEIFETDDDFQITLDSWIAKEKYTKLIGLWIKGFNFEWERLYKDRKPCRISLPTYPFARESYFVAENRLLNAPGVKVDSQARLHPLLHINTSDFFEQRFSSTFTGKEFFLSDHVVDGQCLLPGVAYLEMARAAVEKSTGLRENEPNRILLKNVVWTRPVAVGENPVQLHVGLFPEESGEIAYEIYSEPEDVDAGYAVHGQGKALLQPVSEISVLDIEALKSRCSHRVLSAAQCYDRFKAMGLDYGPAHRGIEKVYANSNQVLAKLALPDSLRETKDQFVLHPSLTDAALQASIGLMPVAADARRDGDLKPALPFELEELAILSGCTPKMWAHIRDNHGGKVQKLDIDLCDETGRICVRIKGFSARSPEGAAGVQSASAAPGTLLLAPGWKEETVDRRPLTAAYEVHQVMLCEFDESKKADIETRMRGVRCMHLPSEGHDIAQRFQTCARQVFLEIRTMIENKIESDVLLQIVVPRQGDQRLFAALCGLLKTARLEHPKIIGQLIELEPGAGGDLIVNRLNENAQRPADIHIRYRNGARLVAKWKEIDAPDQVPEIPWKEKGVYLITGGGGGLGLIFANEIVKQTRQVTLILTGRSKLDPARQKQIDELCRAGADIAYYRVDVAKEEEVARLLKKIGRRCARLDGIIHGAGIVRDNYMIKKKAEEFEQVLLPKVAGLVNLDHASRHFDLDFLVLFSSVSSSLGNPGQCDYAAANSFMDAYAAYRNRLVSENKRQGHTVSINWPLWKEGGMHVDAITEQTLRQSMGMAAMPTRSGIRAFYQALGFGTDQVMVMEGERERMKQSVGLKRPSDPPPKTLSDKPAKTPSTITFSKDGLSAGMQKYLKDLISRQTRLAVEKIDAHENFDKYGIDSVMAVSMTNQLKSHFGELSNTLFFEYISVAEMADYFAQQHAEGSRKLLSRAEPAQTRAVVVKEPGSKKKPEKKIDFPRSRWGGPKASPSKRDARPEIKAMAVIGISGRYPMADNVAQYWRNLKEGKDCITSIPGERWDHRLCFDPEKLKPGKSYAQSGGFINDVDKFDPLFFDISPREAETIDPQERLFMEIAWEVLEDAGYTRGALKRQLNSSIGVFVGCMYQHYPWLARDCQYDGLVNHNAYWSIANRVSYFLDFQGPSIAIDSACSSSLSAIYLACESLKKGECQMAIAGGVNLNLHPDKFRVLSQNQLLAGDGKCRALGNGDGYLPGEGVGAVLLKPLEPAEKDRDHIYAVIKGGMMNHCGKTSGYMVPNPKAQTDLIVRVFDSAGVHPETVNYMEIAANGSSLGDAIEITGLKKAFKQFTDKKHFCSIGTVKSNIGHLEAASGISQLTKLVCQMQHKTLAPSINTEPANENIDLAESPFFIQKELTPWEKPAIEKNGRKKTYPRTAAISSFGAGGANTTILVQEYEDRRQMPAHSASGPAIVPLSAKTERQLDEYVAKLSAFLEKQNGSAFLEHQRHPVDHRNLAYTLQTGREPMQARLAIVVNSLEELQNKLQAICADPFGDIDGVFRSNGIKNPENRGSLSAARPNVPGIHHMIKNGEFDKIACAWVEGQTIDWRLFPQNADRDKISLPTYAFERRRCWVTPPGRPLGPPARSMVTGCISHVKSEIATPVAPKPEAAPSTGDQIANDIKNELAAFFGLAQDDFKPDIPMDRFGFDSIKAINFRYRLEKRYGVSIPMNEIGKSRTLNQLVDNLAKAVKAQKGTPDENEIPKLVQTFLQDRTDLSSICDHALNELYKNLASH